MKSPYLTSSLVLHWSHTSPIGLLFIGPLHWNFPLVTSIHWKITLVTSIHWKLTLVTHIGSYWIGTVIIETMVVPKRQPFHIGLDIRWLV